MVEKLSVSHIALLILVGMILALSACSPKATVNKYSYLITEPARPVGVKPHSRPAVESREVAVEGDAPVRVGTMGAVNKSRRRQENQEVGRVVETAKSYLGTPYRYGGMSHLGVDCSGLMCLSYQSVNKSLPRTSEAMANAGSSVSKGQLEPGHLVFFDAKNGHGINHVGLAIEGSGGDIAFIHATSSGGVRIDRLNDPYWSERFRKAVAP
ncbi:MAG: C40 family peptidase [Bacteroidia bacterium]|nr:C40 family peptidase [Bacteroidia bacterium]